MQLTYKFRISDTAASELNRQSRQAHGRGYEGGGFRLEVEAAAPGDLRDRSQVNQGPYRHLAGVNAAANRR